MSINFNKLFIQDILSHRESSHTLDLNEENVKEECEYSTEYNENDEGDESDDVVDDEYDNDNESEVSNYTDDGTGISNNKNNYKTTNNLLSGEDSQRFRLISALNNLRLAVDKQANLQSMLSDYKNKVRLQDYKVLSRLSTVTECQNTTDSMNNETNHLMKTTTLNNKIDANGSVENADEEKGETTSPNSKTNPTTATCKSLKKQIQHNTMDIPISLMDKDTLGFRRNERLSRRKERLDCDWQAEFRTRVSSYLGLVGRMYLIFLL